MRDPLQTPALTEIVIGNDAGSDVPAVPANRAERRGTKRGKSGKLQVSSSGRSRQAQGRRINPVRRTG